MECKACKGTGLVRDTTADVENGPSSHPGADMMFERPCDECEKGYALWLADAEASDKATREFFAALDSGDPEAQRKWTETWDGPSEEEAAWERRTERLNR